MWKLAATTGECYGLRLHRLRSSSPSYLLCLLWMDGGCPQRFNLHAQVPLRVPLLYQSPLRPSLLPAAIATSSLSFSMFLLLLLWFVFKFGLTLFAFVMHLRGLETERGLLALDLCSSEVGYGGSGHLAGAAQLGGVQRHLHPTRHPWLRAPSPGEERPEGIPPVTHLMCPSDQSKTCSSNLFLPLPLPLPLSCLIFPCPYWSLFASLCCTALLGILCANVVIWDLTFMYLLTHCGFHHTYQLHKRGKGYLQEVVRREIQMEVKRRERDLLQTLLLWDEQSAPIKGFYNTFRSTKKAMFEYVMAVSSQ